MTETIPELVAIESDEGERLRASISVDYFPRLAQNRRNEAALEYSDLKLRYREERLRPGRRGLVVVKSTERCAVNISEHFGYLTLSTVNEGNKPWEDKGKVQLEFKGEPSLSDSQEMRAPAIPYGTSLLLCKEVEERRRAGALYSYLAKRILSNFEADAVRAVIGDFSTSTELDTSTVAKGLATAWQPVILSTPPRPESAGANFVQRSLYAPDIVAAVNRCVYP